MKAIALSALSSLFLGCASQGLFQTAHSLGPGGFQVTGGETIALNRTLSGEGHEAVFHLSGQLDGRMGLTRSLDVGFTPHVNPWYGNGFLGLGLDAKYNLLDNQRAFAVAPRLAVAVDPIEDAEGSPWGKLHRVLEAGGIASYRVTNWFEPYAALGLSNHWVPMIAEDEPIELAPGERLADREGYGNGVVEMTLGADLSFSRRSHIMLEYSLWLPAQNDPGDGYQFVTSHIFGLCYTWQKPIRD